MKQEKSKVRKAGGIVKKALVVKIPRTTKPKAQKKIDLEYVEKEAIEEESEGTMTLN